MRQLEQEYSGHAEGESDLKRMCQPGESCRNQVEEQARRTRLLRVRVSESDKVKNIIPMGISHSRVLRSRNPSP